MSKRKQEPHSDDVKSKDEYISRKENRDKVSKIVRFFGFDKGLEDTTNRLYEAVQHVSQEDGPKAEKELMNAESYKIPAHRIVDEVVDAIEKSDGNREKYVPPRRICKHFAYLLGEISRHQYGHNIDIVSTKAGCEILNGLTRHVVVYDRTEDVYRDPTPYKRIFHDGEWKDTSKAGIKLHNLTHKQVGVRKRNST
jgi:hypothetical protein